MKDNESKLTDRPDERAETAAEATTPSVEQTAASPARRCAGHGCCRSRRRDVRGKLHCYNWLSDIPGGYADDEMVEVQFKNTRKGFYKNSQNIPLEIGDLVAVEAAPGHDIGRVTMVGALVRLQMRKVGVKPNAEIRRVFRKARPLDIEKFEEAKAREVDTMIRSRLIAENLKLNMKIGDVEYQGDGSKAIFYYIADERVDFRQLIKVLAETFKVRIEMKQIGARQEAGRVGGIGPCGRPLCCASWMTNFVSVSTSAARYQDISLNPQKLAGQCAKLKCCLNFEMDAYAEASKSLPPRNARLETEDSTYYHFKTDVFKREITYSTDKSNASNLVTLDPERVFEIIALNKEGVKPKSLKADGSDKEDPRSAYNDLLDQDELTRFDHKKKKKKKKNKNKDKDKKADAAASQAPDQKGGETAPTVAPRPGDESGAEGADEANGGQAPEKNAPKDGRRNQRKNRKSKPRAASET